MFINYLKVALRNVLRHKGYTIINIIGLAVGMACFVLIVSYVRHVLSFDRFHRNYDNIYRVITTMKDGAVHGGTPAPLAEALKSEIPEIARTVRVTGTGDFVTYRGKSTYERQILLVDPSFLDVFTFPLVRGDPDDVLARPGSIVVSEDVAKKYFGDDEPIGKTIRLGDLYDFKVTGVSRDVSNNSSLRFDFLLRFDFINTLADFNYLGSWGAYNFTTFVQLRKGALPGTLAEKIVTVQKKHIRSQDPDRQIFSFQPLSKVVTDSRVRGSTVIPLQYLYFGSAIGFLILILACVNYANLSVAQSLARSREVGIRKVVGAFRAQIARQFLVEAVLLASLALPLTIGIVELLLPRFNALAKSRLSISYVQDWDFLAILIGVALFAGLVSGAYPALYSSGLQPVKAIRGAMGMTRGKSILRNILIVLQFSISIFFVICTLIIHSQLMFIHDNNLGCNKEQVVDVSIYSDAISSKFGTMKTELLRNPHILSVAASSFTPGGGANMGAWWEGKPEDRDIYVRWYMVGYDFIKTLQIQMKEGRDFSQAFPTDSLSAYILNEAAVKEFGWDSGVGKEFDIGSALMGRGKVIGVVKDFNFNSLHSNVGPMALTLSRRPADALIRIAKENIAETIAFIESKWKEFDPSKPFEYTFLDEEFDQLYTAEQRTAKVFSFSAAMAIFIACLGLLGLASYSIARRTGEIAVRKVFGANSASIVTLLSKEFTRLILVANILAWPLAYVVMNRWLQSFAYRIEMTIWYFVLSGLLALFISLLTVSFRSVRAAMANPVDSLRYE
jgi:putative ABC transport system permease protein